MSNQLPAAEEMNYFKTSQKAPDTWLDKATEEIEEAGGIVRLQAKGFDSGHSAYCMEFELDGQPYRIVWPILPCKNGNEKAAERQAATMMYHDVKARAMKAKIFGSRTAFFDFMLLPDGRTAAMLTSPELIEHQPKLLSGGDY